MDESHSVLYAPEAEKDLARLYEYIVDRIGNPTIADGFVGRIRAFCDRLRIFPERGTRRFDLAKGLRTIGFERRATILFVVSADTVQVLRIHYRGRDIKARP